LAIAYPPAEPDLWVKELPDGPPTRLTMDEGSDRAPVWSRNGETITYTWWRAAAEIGEVRSVRADGSSEGRYEVIFERAAGEVQLTHDERGMVFREGNSTDAPDPRDREGDIGFVDLTTGEVRERMIESSSIERSISLSPDDRFLAYVSDESGTDEVYVRPWPDVESWEVRVSRNGGGEPLWSHGGRELFYREPVSGAMMVATFVEDPTFRVASRESLFDASPYLSAGGPWRAYDVASDDQRFIMIRRQHSSEGAVPLIVVQNFFEDLRRLAPN
jgi:Tol biopolymer transport system component